MKLKLSILAIAIGSLGSAHADLFWNPNGTSATWTAANWSSTGSSPFTTAWATNTNVQFTADSTVTFATTSIGNVTVADGRTVTIAQAGTLSTNGAVRTFDVGTGSTLTWTTQNVSANSSSGFIKSGSGIWNIGAQGNLYTGGFTLNAGTVIVSGNNSFGGAGSALAINGGTIQSSGTRAYTNSAVTIGGNFTNSGTGTATFSGSVNLGAATRTITNDTTSGSRIYSGVISGASGSGLTFSGAGAGQTYIGNTSNSFTGTISINSSEVGFANNGAFGNAANTIVVDGGRLSAASTAGGSASYTLASTHGIQVGSTAGTSISTVSGGVLTYDGVISDKTGSTGAWAKQGSGTLALGGSSSYTGNTAINNGSLQLTTGNNRLPTGTVVSLGQAASANLGTLDLNGRSQQLAGLVSTSGTNATASNNTVTSATAATLTLDGSGSYGYGDGTNANSGVITGGISLVKNGSGTQTLGDTNTYTGTTTVNNGKLVINGSVSTSVTTVNNGGTIGGTGTVGALTVKSGATLAPGNSPGILNVGNTILEAGSTLGIELDGNAVGTGYDQVSVTGTVSLAGLLSVTMGFTPADNTMFFILANDSTDAVSGTFSNAAVNQGTYTLGGQAFKISYFGDTTTSSFTGGNDVVLMAVPEPAASLLGGIGFLCLLSRRRN
jgi:autotransporter-associated beta strand protein